MQVNKISAYIGFAIKAGKVIYGIDAVEVYRKKTYLLIASEDISENSFKAAKKIQERLKVPLAVTQGIKLEELVHKPNCKFIAITVKNLSDAILENASLNNNFIIYPWEDKE